MYIQNEEEYQQALTLLEEFQNRELSKLPSSERMKYNEVMKAVDHYHQMHDPMLEGQWAFAF